MSMWTSVRKYYCSGCFEDQIYDEPNTADTWWNVDVSTTKPYPDRALIITFSLSFQRTTYSPTHIFHFISGLIRAWSHGVLRSTPWYCGLHGFHGRYGMPLGMEVGFSLDTCLWWVISARPKMQLYLSGPRLKIHLILPAAQLLRRRNSHTSNEKYIKRFWRRCSEAWNIVLKMVKPIVVEMASTGCYIPVF